MITFYLDIATEDRKVAIDTAKRYLMGLFGLIRWPENVTIEATIEGDDGDGFVEWQFEVSRG